MKKLAIILFGLSFSISAAAAVWMWTDDEGRVNYSDYPDNPNAVLVDIQSDASDRNAIADRRQAAVERERERIKGDRLRRESDAEDSEQEKQDRRMAKSNCERAKEIYETYYNAPRLYKPTQGGGREFLSAEETDALRAKAQASVTEWCG